MAGSKGLHTAFGDAVARRELIEFLVGIADFHGRRSQALAHSGHEVLSDGLFNQDDSGAESGLIGIVNGVVQDGLAIAAQGINLFQPAIAAAHAGRQNNKYRFIHHRMLLLFVIFLCCIAENQRMGFRCLCIAASASAVPVGEALSLPLRRSRLGSTSGGAGSEAD